MQAYPLHFSFFSFYIKTYIPLPFHGDKHISATQVLSLSARLYILYSQWSRCTLLLVFLHKETYHLSIIARDKKSLSFQIQGPHLLAPTGSDLKRYGQEGTVFAGYHYDLNFLTIHGRSRFPGLNIWLRNGQKIEVKVPIGCLLIQTGKQVRDMSTNFHCLMMMVLLVKWLANQVVCCSW